MRGPLVDHHDANRPSLSDHLRFPPVVGVNGVEPSEEAALGIALLRLVGKDHHHLAGDVDPCEVVVVVLGGRDSIAGEDEWSSRLEIDTPCREA
jgi:hypothetical protein